MRFRPDSMNPPYVGSSSARISEGIILRYVQPNFSSTAARSSVYDEPLSTTSSVAPDTGN